MPRDRRRSHRRCCSEQPVGRLAGDEQVGAAVVVEIARAERRPAACPRGAPRSRSVNRPPSLREHPHAIAARAARDRGRRRDRDRVRRHALARAFAEVRPGPSPSTSVYATAGVDSSTSSRSSPVETTASPYRPCSRYALRQGRAVGALPQLFESGQCRRALGSASRHEPALWRHRRPP